MSEILDEFGSNTSQPQSPHATNGGQVPVRDVHNYKPPVGPKNIGDSKSPGLHGSNLGSCGTQHKG